MKNQIYIETNKTFKEGGMIYIVRMAEFGSCEGCAFGGSHVSFKRLYPITRLCEKYSCLASKREDNTSVIFKEFCKYKGKAPRKTS